MKNGIGIIGCIALITLGTCFWVFWKSPNPATTIQELKYPVVVFFSPSQYYIRHSAMELSQMTTQTVLTTTTPPDLIDNDFTLYRIEDLKSVESPYKIMLRSGSGDTPVSFTLHMDRERSVADAKRLLLGIINPSMANLERADLEQHIQEAATLQEALAGL